MADVAATTPVKVEPGGSFNFFGLTITRASVDAGKLAAEATAAGAGNTLTYPTVALPKGFVPVSLLPPNGATAALSYDSTNKKWSLAISAVSATTGIVEFLILGHY